MLFYHATFSGVDSCNFCEHVIYLETELQLEDDKKWKILLAQVPGYVSWNSSLSLTIKLQCNCCWAASMHLIGIIRYVFIDIN